MWSENNEYDIIEDVTFLNIQLLHSRF